MTTAAESAVSEKEAAKEALKARAAEIAEKEKKANEGRTGKGLRVFYGMTRGRNPQMIDYENWDLAQPATLPESLSDFMSLRKMEDEKEIVRRLLAGDNEILYSEASDPVAEFVNPAWDDEVKKQFRTVVRNYANATECSIEDAVALIKPGIEAAQAKK